jgi:mannose/fructose/N-acetylgalactosamine-specific phosphotransferase system component IIC
MLPDPGTALWLVLLGGWMAVDGTSCGQFMVSRPLVAATLAGWVVGDPLAGLRAGIVLELFHLAVLPVGAARYPEGGPAAVVAGSLYAASAATVPGALLMSVTFALVWEWVGGESLRVMRQLNVRLIAGPEEHSGVGQLQRRHLAAILLDFVRGMLVVGVGLIFLSTLLIVSAQHWSLDPQVAGLAVSAATVGLLAATLGVFGGRGRLFVVGMAAGLLFVLVRG